MAASCTRVILPHSASTLALLSFICFIVTYVLADGVENCENLRLGQYRCNEPKIDDATQEPDNCRDSIAWVECLPAPNISCRFSNGTEFKFSGEEVGFNKSIPCRNVNGYSYKVAVALSLFLGWLGADRFYLGYPALAPARSQRAQWMKAHTPTSLGGSLFPVLGDGNGSSTLCRRRLAWVPASSSTWPGCRRPAVAPLCH
ncbi:TM2 domain-containing protein 1 isoform X1 [Scleropages formosus]|uniref:TM2 domain-containing protein 1 isoform X1 n=1 Tax=Scleropages formosus TaxID=113540 RepID=UPI000878F850|nr:TM2 domain-containing protein 1 isoform X1 [Scleropages formosus]